jgi:hypothetical protein
MKALWVMLLIAQHQDSTTPLVIQQYFYSADQCKSVQNGLELDLTKQRDYRIISSRCSPVGQGQP